MIISPINKIHLPFVFLSIFLLCNYSICKSPNLIKDLSNTGNHNIFVKILEQNPLFLSLISNSIESTIYAPSDKAFDAMPPEFKNEIKKNNIKYTTKIILTHIFSGNNLDNKSDEGMVLSLDGSLYYTYEVGDLFVKDIVMQGNHFTSGKYTVIPVDCVMFLQQSSKDPRLDKKIQEKYQYTTCCLETAEEYNEFTKNLK